MGISRQDALECFESDDLIGVGMEADAVRRRLHPEGVASYPLDGRVDYTNAVNSAGFEDICNQISAIEAKGGTAIILRGDVTPEHTIAWFDGLFRGIRQRFPTLWLHSLSASEILAITRDSGLPIEDVLARLRDAGLNSIPGDDAGLRDDAVHSRGVC